MQCQMTSKTKTGFCVDFYASCYLCGTNYLHNVCALSCIYTRSPYMIQCTSHHLLNFSILLLISLDREEKMKPNKAYETVTRPQSAEQVHTEPCPAYEVPTI